MCYSLKRAGLKKGFTLIELSLSIAFIAILSLTIVMIINESIGSYRRGITLNKINTTGMDLVDDMRAAVQNSTSRSIVSECATIYENSEERGKCEKADGYRLVMTVREGTVSGGVGKVPLFGAFCTGNYSYIWNSGYYFADGFTIGDNIAQASLKYRMTSNSGEHTIKNFKLLKVKDDTRRVCLAAMVGNEADEKNWKYVDNEIGSVFDIARFGALDEEPFDVLGGKVVIDDNSSAGDGANNNLAIYDLEAAKPAISNAQRDVFYSVSFILGTTQGGINVFASGNYCDPPEGYDSAVENFNYCAINKFNFAAQAMGG